VDLPTLPQSNLKLLIVDDDPTTRALLAEALERRGASVRASATAREARQTLVVWHPDLMISDVGMPRESGYELIRRVRDLPAEEGGSTPAIACTGYAREEDRARAMDAGFDAVVAKPVDLDLLVSTIACVIPQRTAREASGAPAARPEPSRHAHVAGVREPGAVDAAAGVSDDAFARRSAPDS
jgi:CheY-like chemotaxis protein